ncbi:MAG: hypothetical protein Q7S76_03765 [bacterium]|nr:hypothetical protein [bacterium]
MKTKTIFPDWYKRLAKWTQSVDRLGMRTSTQIMVARVMSKIELMRVRKIVKGSYFKKL